MVKKELEEKKTKEILVEPVYDDINKTIEKGRIPARKGNKPTFIKLPKL